MRRVGEGLCATSPHMASEARVCRRDNYSYRQRTTHQLTEVRGGMGNEGQGGMVVVVRRDVFTVLAAVYLDVPAICTHVLSVQ